MGTSSITSPIRGDQSAYPTGGTDGTGSLGVRGLRTASRPHRDCNIIYCITIRSNVSLIAGADMLTRRMEYWKNGLSQFIIIQREG